MHEGSRRAIIAALLANLGIAVSKVVAFAITRSASMLAEAIHSFADTGNQALLILGGRRAQRAPDAEHPFGHGTERYFWAFIVALVLFGAIGARVWFLQVIDSSTLRERVQVSARRSVTLLPRRGRIFDAKGRVTCSPMNLSRIGVYLWKQAVEKAGTFEVDAVRTALIGQKFKAPTGEVTMQENHHLINPVFIGETLATGQFKIIKSLGAVAGEPFSEKFLTKK